MQKDNISSELLKSYLAHEVLWRESTKKLHFVLHTKVSGIASLLAWVPMEIEQGKVPIYKKDAIFNHDILDKVGPDNISLIAKSLNALDNLFLMDKIISINSKHANTVLSCILHALSENDERAMELRGLIQKAASLLELGPLQGVECLQDPEVYEQLKAIRRDFENSPSAYSRG